MTEVLFVIINLDSMYFSLQYMDILAPSSSTLFCLFVVVVFILN